MRARNWHWHGDTAPGTLIAEASLVPLAGLGGTVAGMIIGWHKARWLGLAVGWLVGGVVAVPVAIVVGAIIANQQAKRLVNSAALQLSPGASYLKIPPGAPIVLSLPPGASWDSLKVDGQAYDVGGTTAPRTVYSNGVGAGTIAAAWTAPTGPATAAVAYGP